MTIATKPADFKTFEEREREEIADLIAMNAGLSPKSCTNFELKTPGVVSAQSALIWHLWNVKRRPERPPGLVKLAIERLADTLRCPPALVKRAIKRGLRSDAAVLDLLKIPEASPPKPTAPNELALMVRSDIVKIRISAIFLAVERTFGRTKRELLSSSTAKELVHLRRSCALVAKYAGVSPDELPQYFKRTPGIFRGVYQFARCDIKEPNDPLRRYVKKLCEVLIISFEDLVRKA